MRLVKSLLIALVILLASNSPVVADHTMPPVLPGMPTLLTREVMVKGYVTYALDVNTNSYPNFAEQAIAVVEAGIASIGIPGYRVDTDPDIWLTMPDDETFIKICGSGAAGCIQYWTEPVMIFFRRALLYFDWRTTIAHEGVNGGHAFGEHEQYDDTSFRCLTTRTWTVMSCGTGQWQLQDFDRNIIWNLMVPDLPSRVTTTKLNGFLFVQWNGIRADAGFAHFGNPLLDNITRVATFYSDNAGETWNWTGSTCGEQYDYCYGLPASPSSIMSRGFDLNAWCRPGRLWGVRPENAATYGIPYISGQIAVAGSC